MSVTYDHWRASASDLELCARNFLNNPKSDGAKAELRRACDRAAALAKLENAARAIEDTRPGARSEEPLAAGSAEASDPPRPRPRLPYADDDREV